MAKRKKVVRIANRTYKWASGVRARVHAQEAGEEMERIRRSYGELTPDIVVKEAKKKTSPLHPAFEWDDTEAAQLYRHWQAGAMITTIRVIEERGTEYHEPKRIFLNVHKKGQPAEYHTTAEVMNSPKLRAMALEKLEGECDQLAKKLLEYKEFMRVYKAMEETKPKIKRKIAQLKKAG